MNYAADDNQTKEIVKRIKQWATTGNGSRTPT